MDERPDVARLINQLIGTLQDGERGYKKASEAAKDPRLKSLFDDYAHQRVRFLAELRDAVRRRCQFEPPQTTSAIGALHRAWINLRIAISRDDRAILAECERGEDSAMHEYQKAAHNRLASPLREIISHQYHEVRSAHDRIHYLRLVARAA
jgi:uncharacterized protein (TIGR02284 family)